MTTTLDIVIKEARLRHEPGAFFDIGIHEGRIHSIEPVIRLSAHVEIAARGNLVTESFVDPHLHLDKVFTSHLADEHVHHSYMAASMGKAMKAIEVASLVKKHYQQDWIVENVRRSIASAIRFGNTHIRAFADVDSKARLEAVKALIQVRDECRGVIEIQVVAFPQDGVVRDPGAAELVREAMKLGADIVGGIPWIEYSDADAKRHIDEMFSIAKECDRGISMLVDDAGDPGLRCLEMLALKTIEEGWQGRVLAHHARAMALYPEPYLQKLVALLKAARIGIASNPHTAPLSVPIKELVQEGVLVCLGQDSNSDAYYPYGRNNMLEVAFLVSHVRWMTTATDRELLYDLVTRNAAKAIGLTDFEVKVGAPANLVVLGVPNVQEALRQHEAPTHVISHGKVIAGVASH